MKLAEFHRLIADECRRLVRRSVGRNLKSLKGKDAIHLATAKYVDADEMHSFDDALLSAGDLVDFEIVLPRNVKNPLRLF